MSFARRCALAATLAVGAIVGFSFAGHAQDGAKPAAAPAQAAPAKADGKKAEVINVFLGNETCPVSGKAVKKGLSVDVEGQKVYVCCKDCVAKVKADGKAMLAVAYKDVKAVDNKTCPVSGHAIEAGKAKEVTWQGRKFNLCCGDCEKAFAKEPMIAAAKAIYGAEDLKNAKCPVMDEASEADKLVIYKGKIVRLCCDDCHHDFAKDPDKFFAKAGGK